MNEALASQIIREIPKTDPVKVSCVMGASESCQLAHEIFAFQKNNGYKTSKEGVAQAVYSQPVRGINFVPGMHEFQIGPQ